MSEEKPHPIQLQRLLFTKSIVEALEGHEIGPVIVPAPTNKFSVVRDPEHKKHWQVSIRTLVNEARDVKYPYYVDMECLAQFVVDDTLNDDEAHRAAMITGHNVLYGAVREAVGWITGRQIYGSLVLGLSVLRPVAPEPVEPAKGDEADKK